MAVSLNMGSWNKVFAVPYELVEKHIKLCSVNELRFILWLLANPNKQLDKKVMCSETGIKEELFDDCLEYWILSGLLRQDDDTVSANIKQVNVEKSKDDKPKAKERKKMLRPDSFYISQRINESSQLANFFQEVQNLLGKTISPSLSSVLLIAHDDYLLPCEVIYMLLSYCASIEKISTTQIENIIKSWYQDGINTLELAEEKLKELDERNQAWIRYSSLIGLTRKSAFEEELAYKVIYQMKFSDEMIKLAYKTTVDAINEYKPKYISKVFSSWFVKQYTTPSDVPSQESKQTENTGNSSYDLGDFYKLNMFNLEDDKS